MLKKLFKRNLQESVSIIDQCVVSGSNFVLGILLAKALGLDQYGVYALIWMLVLFATSIHQAFIINPLLTLGPKKEPVAQKNYLKSLGVIHILFCVLAFACCVLGVTASIWLKPSWGIAGYSWPIAFVVISYLSIEYIRKYHYSTGRPMVAFFVDLTGYGLQILAISIAWLMGWLTVKWAIVLVGVSFSIGTLVGTYHHVKLSTGREEILNVHLENWKFSRWLTGTALLKWFSGNFFIVAAGGILGTAAVGVIRIVQNIMGVTHVLFLAFENFIPPKAAINFKLGGIKQLFNYLKKTTLVSGAMTLVLLTGIFVFGGFILRILYGQEYVEYAYVVQWFGVLYVFVFFGYPLRYALRTIENTRPIFISYVFSVTASLLLAYPLINHFDLIGVVLGLIMVQVIMQLCYLWFLKEDFAVVWRRV